MNYQQIIPPPYIKEYVRYFWVLESDSDNLFNRKLLPLADGCPGIIFQHSSMGSLSSPDHQHWPDIILYGQTVKPTQLILGEKFKTMGVCFYPYALKTIFGFNANELTESCVDLKLLMKDFIEPLTNAESVSSQLEVFGAYLYRQVQRRSYHLDYATAYALTEIIQSKGNLPLKALQKKLKLSERGFERRFNEHVGISPKLFSRVCKFQAALSQLKSNNYSSLSDVAFDNGYADQSHFVRNFKEFAGLPPHQFKKHGRKITENFSVI